MSLPKISSKLKRVLAEVGIFYVAAIWGATFFVVKDSLKFVDPVVMVGYRFVLSALILGLFLLVKKRKIFKNFKEGLILGLFLWLIYIPQTVGLLYTSAANSGFITGLFVVFVPVFSFFFFKKVPSWAQVLAITLSIIGLWVLTGGIENINKGDVLTIFAAMAYAFYLLFSDLYLNKKLDPYILAFQEFLFVGIASFVWGLFAGLPLGYGGQGTLGVIVFLALFASLFAFVILLLAQKYTTPLRTSLILASEPLIAALFAWTLGQEKAFVFQIFGGILIVASIIISELKK